ncbi:oxidative stress defense protein [Shewanella fidelis]|uniref:Oxidative stress defense protein n=1 Tax=Shewanella fidelis TaxID=173509 RepID=A0AAW8NR04_9GAMM|nr:oxidative stress defense protein [Shewanella fidelis]MDR8525147.1 oxidative stress defense protein [Shewanella fidelis]MDW4811218.1 oxidative stress defense protein [Shewanella fidelis]MDW4815003.1 oxidative stress defense protein [Shewanella fidelis]MDW4819093.1 oxidative stress defense protein [Shewanella fidelis]MDW4823229.1 oxidative stress defense protein [Shewanella fidelis]
MKSSIIAAVISTVIASTSLVATAQAADVDFAHLNTIGTSELTVKADMAEVNVEVVIKAKTAQQAKRDSDKAVARFLERLEKAGVDKALIQSANINLQPQYHYEKNKPSQLIGYSANRRITVTVMDLTKLNNILDSALKQGINRINNIALKSSKEAQYVEQARMAAIKDAQQKAKSLAEGFGEELDGVWQISYYEQRPIQPVMLRMNSEAKSFDAGQSYQQGQVVIQDRVEVTYRLK